MPCCIPALTLLRLRLLHSLPKFSSFRPIALALALAAAGGAAFAWLDLPLPWMLGALVATMAGSLAGLQLAIPSGMRQPMIAIVGVLLGSSFTMERMEAIQLWLPSVATLPVYVFTIGMLILFYLRRFSDFDRRTAFFAATPGGLSEMVALADQLGGDPRTVSLIHTARLVLIVFSVPFIARLAANVDLSTPVVLDQPSIKALDLVLLGLTAAAGWVIGGWLRLPAAPFMGPLFCSAALHLFGLVEQSPPAVLTALAQLVIGGAVGARFCGVPWRLIGKTLTLGTGAALLMFAVTCLFAVVLDQATGLGFALLLIALIPGGFTEMSLIALAMGVDPAFVVTHHGMRVFLVVAFAWPIYALLRRTDWFERHPGQPDLAPSQPKESHET